MGQTDGIFQNKSKIGPLQQTGGAIKCLLFYHYTVKVNKVRALTALSPLQYQKRLRLNEARRLMLAESPDVTTVAFQMGYESATKFSREYSRLFGAPSVRDIKNLRQVTKTEGIWS